MKSAIPLLASSLLLLSSCEAAKSTTTTPNPSTNPSSWVMGYYVGYLKDKMPISAIDWKNLTHLAVGVILPKADGSLNFDIAFNASERAAIVKAAHSSGRKAIAMIGGSDTGPQWLLASSGAARATFIANLKKLVQLEGFDGLDLDWEPLTVAQQPKALELTKDLRAALPKAILTFPADGIGNSNFPEDRSFYKQLAPYLDQLNLMTYGMSGAYDGWKTWHSSPLYSSDSAAPTSIDFALKGFLDAGVPAAKLGLGIGFYGLCYSPPATSPLEDTIGRSPTGSSIIADDGDISYANIVNTYLPLGTRKWDATARVPYLSFSKASGPAKCGYISYEDEQSLLEKAKFSAAKGLGGVIIWNINQGYFAGKTPTNPLLEVIGKAWLEGK
jgi:chitinase